MDDGIHTLGYFHKDLKNRKWRKLSRKRKTFLQMKKSSHEKEMILTNKQMFSQKRNDSHKWKKVFTKKSKFAQMVAHKNKCAQMR